uniref:Putative ataxin-10 n=1 Tax=Davidia involucrata TaxID=16924 RepID=A0A5B6YGT3_DAVIN
MDDASVSVLSLPENILLPLFSVSNSSTIERAVEILTEASKTADGRSDLASKNILPIVLQLCQNLSDPSASHLLLLSLKLLRNLCAGEVANQNLFIEQNGVGIVLAALNSLSLASDSDYGIIRMGLQILANVSLAGEKHQRAIWHQFFPCKFVEIASVRRKETCDPVCMIIYTCCDGSHGLFAELCGDQGLPIMTDIVRTASAVGFGEDWLKLLLSKICLEENLLPQLFSKLWPAGASENTEDIKFRDGVFVSEQAFLLNILSGILNERIEDISISNDFALYILGILKQAVGVVDFVSRGKSGLPTGSVSIDVLGYSLTILRDICASDGVGGFTEDSVDVVDSLVSSGFLELLLCLLRELEPPTIIRKAMKQDENQEGTTSYSPKLCPYKGFRRDIVAVIGNCAYRRKHIQDEIRQKNEILLLLQQCVIDEDNPFLREWGIWSVRNLLEGNAENQRVVAELELQGSVDVPEIAGLGLRVEFDQRTRRAKLVNAL